MTSLTTPHLWHKTTKRQQFSTVDRIYRAVLRD